MSQLGLELILYLSRPESDGEAAAAVAVGALGGQGVQLHPSLYSFSGRSSCKTVIRNGNFKQETAACFSVSGKCS